MQCNDVRFVFLHGFPETMYAWKELSFILGQDYEVHAFDWPGYGLSTRPPVEKFSYAPKDYAYVLREYIRKTGINPSKLLVYATDIGSLPTLLLALEEPKIMKKIIVGDDSSRFHSMTNILSHFDHAEVICKPIHIPLYLYAINFTCLWTDELT